MNTFEKQQAAKLLSCYITPEEIQKALDDNDIEKAHPVGYINKNGYQKQPDGKYKYVGKDKTSKQETKAIENQESREAISLSGVKDILKSMLSKAYLGAEPSVKEISNGHGFKASLNLKTGDECVLHIEPHDVTNPDSGKFFFQFNSVTQVDSESLADNRAAYQTTSAKKVTEKKKKKQGFGSLEEIIQEAAKFLKKK